MSMIYGEGVPWAILLHLKLFHALPATQFHEGSVPVYPLPRDTISSVQLLPVTMVKEPRAFKKVRHKQEQMAGHLQAEEGGAGGGAEEGEEEDHAPLITGKELDFIPLELNAGSYVHTNNYRIAVNTALGAWYRDGASPHAIYHSEGQPSGLLGY